ncbi:hypothetical protein OHB41_49445 [Streptomyces sp. NBC_01571]|uniref:hypothetical protein n=1 Tax=Streptomyces sp. NBC_01571 TaxID=2975883 RepID=UPI00224EA2B3|nr:hypothetical protein [Streptomyces sp. NBC_01571]MCX4580988.1 hypothetical protein [Streptomyces sp. NBC_01571]
MADKADILLQFWLEQRNQARQAEAQQAPMTNIILLVVAATLGFAATRGLDQRSTLLVSLPMVGMGIFGAVISTKNYERYALHITYAQRLRVQLDQLEPTVRIMDEWTAARIEHHARYPRLHKIRLHNLWVCFHAGIAASGVALTILILL